MPTEDSTRKGEMEKSGNDSDGEDDSDVTNNFFLKSISFFSHDNYKSNIKKKASISDNDSPKHIALLSPLANSVVSRCSKILLIPTEELQHCFERDITDTAKQPSMYARNFLEFCSYQALQILTGQPDYLNDKDFRRLTYDMMLAWEALGIENEPLDSEPLCTKQDVEDEDGWSLFYSSSTKTAVEVDTKETIGPKAFARIAPACAVIADVITVDNLFDALTSSSGHRLHFLIYDKYLLTIERYASTP
ncbi:hypothetical protein NMG60_11024149 [Bertholletia excelsa]